MFQNSELIDEMENLKRFAYKLTRNSFDAEDLLHNTMVRAIEKKHLFEPGSKLFSWSSKIMYNMFVSQYRRKTKFESQYDPELHIERKSVDEKQNVKMEVQDVNNAMNHLSEDHREILTMVCVKGMPYAEVSEQLDIPIGTVRSRLSRARENLQVELDRAEITTPFVPANNNQYLDHVAA